MDLVFRHKSGGELWQGDIHDVHSLAINHGNKIRTIALFAIEFQPDIRSSHYEVLKHGFQDSDTMNDAEAQQTMRIADLASDKLASRVRSGRGVLSTCAVGLNRSGLCSALTVMKLSDHGPLSAIALVRAARGHQALSNPLFVDMIHAMAGVKGKHETWTQWRPRSGPDEVGFRLLSGTNL